jgi:hypothetical protein
MPEIKNSFLQGKLNKDLDTRIVPNGQYIDALNMQISKADADNIGVLHNIKGNKAVSSLSLDSTHEIIGSIFDDKNNRIFWFITNDSSNNYIYVWSPDTSSDLNTPMRILSGSFLNFKKSNIITGVNIIEDFLFWTDNLNPPRRINIERAINNNSYYDSEIKISVAKYAPYQAPIVTLAEHDDTIKSKRIEEEFIRFAYRYKFKDNEYSILSPFTSIIFQMDDDGNDIPTISENVNYIGLDGLRGLGASTTMSVMINHVNKITLEIPMPDNHYADYEIKEVEILYKESDSIAIRIMDKIDVSSMNTVEYVYTASNFKSTLPESQLTRVFDAVPNRALAQEVAGNRLIYGNITSKMDLPTIKFRVFSSEKGQDSIDDPSVKHQSIKQRRTYDVGIVLSDIFGRTSPVITSKNSSVYVGAKDKKFDNSSFIGDSLKMLFTELTDNGTLYDEVNNPFGWYSYKVVVKQSEQEYYNVYLPGVFNYAGPSGYFAIHGDNVNKIPRTSDGVEFQDEFSYSKTKVYPKVLNYTNNGVSSFRNSSYKLLDITEVGKLSQHKLPYTSRLFEFNKDHLIAKVPVTMGQFYSNITAGGSFSVLETEPFKSSLDIYYETPTSGLLSDIEISSITLDRLSTSKTSSVQQGITVSEDTPADNSLISYIYAWDNNSNRIPGALVSMSLDSQTNSGRFGLRYSESEGEWEIFLRETFAYPGSVNASTSITVSASLLDFPSETATLTIGALLTDVVPVMSVTSTGINYYLDKKIPILNENTGKEEGASYLTKACGYGQDPTLESTIFKFFGTNGSAHSIHSKDDLEYTITARLYQPNSDTLYSANSTPPWVANNFNILSNKDINSQGIIVNEAFGGGFYYYATEIPFSYNEDGVIDYTDFDNYPLPEGFYHFLDPDTGGPTGVYIADMLLEIYVRDLNGSGSKYPPGNDVISIVVTLVKVSGIINKQRRTLCFRSKTILNENDPSLTDDNVGPEYAYEYNYDGDGLPNKNCKKFQCLGDPDENGDPVVIYVYDVDSGGDSLCREYTCEDANGQTITRWLIDEYGTQYLNSECSEPDPPPPLCTELDGTTIADCCTGEDTDPASPTYSQKIIVDCDVTNNENKDIVDPKDTDNLGSEGSDFKNFFGNVLWYAPYYKVDSNTASGYSPTFENTYEACSSPPRNDGSTPWVRTTVYFAGGVNDDPMVITTSAGQHPWPIYSDSSMNTPAPNGWYRRTDTGVIGRFSWQANAPTLADQNWGWYIDPIACASVTPPDPNEPIWTKPEEAEIVIVTEDNITTQWESPYTGTSDKQVNIP